MVCKPFLFTHHFVLKEKNKISEALIMWEKKWSEKSKSLNLLPASFPQCPCHPSEWHLEQKSKQEREEFKQVKQFFCDSLLDICPNTGQV